MSSPLIGSSGGIGGMERAHWQREVDVRQDCALKESENNEAISQST